MSTPSWRLAAWTLLLVLCTTSQAIAQGLVVAPDALPQAARLSLEARIVQAQSADRRPFAAFARAAALAADRRGAASSPRARFAASLRQLGARGLWPMLEAGALRAPSVGDSSNGLREELGQALLEALGSLRDPRARPVLVAAFRTPRSRAEQRAAAVALGRLCDEPATQELMRWSHQTAPATNESARVAAIAGLGHCRTQASAERLARVLAQAVGDAPAQPFAAEVAKGAAEALGMLGSSWAWRAIVANHPSDRAQEKAEENRVRSIAARALLHAFGRGSQAVAQTAGRSLAMVEHPETARWAAEIGAGASEERRAALAALVARIEVRRSSSRANSAAAQPD